MDSEAGSNQTKNKWLAAAAILTGQLTTSFGMFAVVVALPKIMTSFGVDVNAIQWVMTGYLISRAVPMPALGWMTGLIGRRNLYVIGVLGATVSTALCGLSWDMGSLIFFRVMQGALGAPAMGLGLVFLYEAFPAKQRGLAMGLVLLVGSLGPTIGPTLGGYLVQEISWRAIFFLGLPSGIVSIFLTLAILPPDVPQRGEAIDIFGLITMTVFLVALLLAFTQGQREGWNSGYIVSLFAITAVFFVLFIVTELLVPHPVVHLRLYRNYAFTVTSVVVFLYNAGFVGTNFLVALMLQVVFDFTPLQAGLVLAPGAIFMGWVGLFAGKLSDRVDPRVPIIIGLATFALDMYLFSSLTLLTGVGLVTLLVIAQRGSFGLIQSPITNAIMRTLPPEDRNMGSGLHGVHRGVAAAFGVALCSMILEKRMAVHRVLLGQHHDPFALPVQQSLDAFRAFLIQSGEMPQLAGTKALAALGQILSRYVRMSAYADCFLLLSIIFILALIPAFMCRNRSQRQHLVTPAETDTPAVTAQQRAANSARSA
ncbi:MAG: DHA2 family efflux MFS transporter permease subunit [bacterium]|nr:DHA2 family efflux MFS transporter permease subunit [bacterium]